MVKRAIEKEEVKGAKGMQLRRHMFAVRQREHGIGKGLKKPRALIRMVSIKPGEDLSLLDRKVLNLLQEKVVSDLKAFNDNSKTRHPSGFHEIEISSISAMTGINDYVEIRRITEKLKRFEAIYDVFEPESKKLFDGSSYLFSQQMEVVENEGENGIFRFAFDPGIMSLFTEPQPYAFINLSNVFSFTSKYSLAIYENLALHMHMKSKSWTVGIDDLLTLIGWPREENEKIDFSKVRTKALDIAKREIDALGKFSAFSFEWEANKDSAETKTRKVSSVTFTIHGNYQSTDTTEKAESAKTRTGLHISKTALDEMADQFHDRLGQKTKYRTGALMLRIWQLRVIETRRAAKANGGALGLDFQIIFNTSVGAKQGERDTTFQAVIEREAEHDWPSVPVADDKAIDRVKGQLQSLYKAAAHQPAPSVAAAPDASAPVPVSVHAKSKETGKQDLVDQINRDMNVASLLAQAEDLKIEEDALNDLVLEIDEDVQRLEEIVKEAVKLRDWQKSETFKSNIAAVSEADQDDEDAMPVTGTTVEATEDDTIPF